MTERNVRLSGVSQLAGGDYGEVVVEGVAHIRDDIRCERLEVSGKCRVRGRVHARIVTIEGKCDVEGDIEATEIRISGWLGVVGNVSAERLEGSGLLRVRGLVNAEDVRLWGAGRVSEIGGSRVVIESHHHSGWLRWLRAFEAEVIEGDEVRLTGVSAGLVRGGTVYIGKGCRIDRVQYRQSLHRSDDAVVKHAEQA
ncbi:MAG: polymer-forming cytoskeletal protein [Thermoflavifilum sp.]|nr:polymer-forming cytoskeletal protein [Thermoflavifilum sp.]MCL6514739.1 polymer-forming cytoskeletal protein [Alicyclobacillus sp.]